MILIFLDLLILHLGIIRVSWTNPGPIPALGVSKTPIHQGEYINFSGERLHIFDDMFDYDSETGTTCWGSTKQCILKCNRNGHTFTIWDQQFSFRRGNHQLTFSQSCKIAYPRVSRKLKCLKMLEIT